MSDDIKIDTSAIDKLAADLGTAPDGIGVNAKKALQVAAGNVKSGWRDRLQGSAYVPKGPYSISYDLTGDASETRSELSAEIGPTLSSSQGAIVGLLEMGAPHTAPRGFGLAALADEVPDFEHGLEKAIDDTLKKAGL